MGNKLTQEELKRQLHYNPNIGIFRRKIANSNRVKIGDIAGSKNKRGYIIIKINNKLYRAHRLAWLYTHGYLPEHEIHHINEFKYDNRIDNLEHLTPSCHQKTKKLRVGLIQVLLGSLSTSGTTES